MPAAWRMGNIRESCHPVRNSSLRAVVRTGAPLASAAVSLARRRVPALRLLALEYLEESGKNVEEAWT
jgi:hypothetical protein